MGVSEFQSDAEHKMHMSECTLTVPVRVVFITWLMVPKVERVFVRVVRIDKVHTWFYDNCRDTFPVFVTVLRIKNYFIDYQA